MKLSLLSSKRFKILGAMFALAIGASTMQAANQALTVTPATVGTTALPLSCTTGAGTTPVNVVLKLANALTSPNTVTITVTNSSVLTATPGAGVIVTGVTPASATFTFTSATPAAGISIPISLAPGCAGMALGLENIIFTSNATATGAAFNASTNPYLTATLGVTVGPPPAATGTNLATEPLTLSMGGTALTTTPINLTCSWDGNSSTPGYVFGVPQVISVLSTVTAANGGTPYTVTGLPAWMTYVTTAQGVHLAEGGSATATTVASTLTLQANAACGAALGKSSSIPITLTTFTSPPETKQFNVTLTVTKPSPLRAITASPMSYIKGSGIPATQTVSVTSGLPSVPTPFFSVNPSTLPAWLTVNPGSGIAPLNITFSTTSMADLLAPGNYSARVALQVVTYGDLWVPFTLQVTNGTPTLTWSATSPGATITGNSVTTANYTAGSSTYPTVSVTLTSSDTPIFYNIAFGGALSPYAVNSAQQQGFAFPQGTTIPLAFNYSWASAAPGTTVTGSVSITWGNNNNVTLINISIPVQAAAATLSSVSPASLATATTGSFAVGLLGSGFIGTTGNASLKPTQVGLVSANGGFTLDPNIAITAVTPTLIMISIPASDTKNIPVLATGGTVVLGVCNPSATNLCTSVNGGASFPLTITAGPIIQGITSASTFVQTIAPNLPTLAPFDLISIFGNGFCNTCTSPLGATLTASKFFPTSIADANSKNISVGIYAHGTTTWLASAPLLFASSNQINAVFPAVNAATGVALTLTDTSASPPAPTYDVIVTYNGASSTPYPVNLIATDPGIFTTSSDGLGTGAILKADGTLVSASNPAGIRKLNGAANVSDTVQIYMTGLGVPDQAVGSCMDTGTVGNAVTTTTSNSNTTAGNNTVFTPASMANIIVGSSLLIDTVASTNQETVTVASVTATTFTIATTTKSHNGTTTPFPIVSTTAGAVTGPSVPPTEGYLYALNQNMGYTSASNALFSIDGAIIQSSLLPSSTTPPCFSANKPTAASIGAISPVSGIIGYSGWVPDSVTGLYQVNVMLPDLSTFTTNGTGYASPTTPTSLPIQITTATGASQSLGVTIWVQAQLQVVAPTQTDAYGYLSTSVGNIWAPSTAALQVVANGMTGSASYSLSQGAIPLGLSLDPNTGYISGMPIANTIGNYPITVTATDSGSTLTGKVSFIISVSPGLVLTFDNGASGAGVWTSGTSTLKITPGASGAPIAIIAANAGSGSYTYSAQLAGVSTLPATATLNPTTGAITFTGTPADIATKAVTITVTDSNNVSGTFTFNLWIHS
jgi:hypothetical protein